MMTLKNFRQAQQFAEGTQRAARDAEKILLAEQEKLANSGKLYPVRSVENGHQVTRYVGDSAATFAAFAISGRTFTVNNLKRGSGKGRPLR